ncbi:MAG: hypothetical protein OXF09_04620 [Hyphomicrobiales bacterium]|nr:hypothetical protein [Hyphomicrobiales bacterium]
MSILSFKYNPGSGPITSICVFPAEFDHEKEKILGKNNFFRGLLDTGADGTDISPNVVEKLKLNPIGKGELGGVTGAKDVNVYAFRIGFVMGRTAVSSGVETRIEGPQEILRGHEFENHRTDFDVLIGRDILCKGHFSMSYDGNCLFAW